MSPDEDLKPYILNLLKDEFNEIKRRLTLVEDDLKIVKQRFDGFQKDEQWFNTLFYNTENLRKSLKQAKLASKQVLLKTELKLNEMQKIKQNQEASLQSLQLLQPVNQKNQSSHQQFVVNNFQVTQNVPAPYSQDEQEERDLEDQDMGDTVLPWKNCGPRYDQYYQENRRGKKWVQTGVYTYDQVSDSDSDD